MDQYNGGTITKFCRKLNRLANNLLGDIKYV